jgi:DNA-binding transcriptional LysR family regulator
MNLLRIKYFVEAAKRENFTVASRNLFTTQPNLSKQIAVMEEELGVQLFHRVNHNVFLTQAGHYLYDQLKDIPDTTSKAFEHAKALNRSEKGTITVGILEGMDVNLVMADRFAKLYEEYPNLKIAMERNSFRNLRKGLENYQYDFIITLSFELRNVVGGYHETLIEQKGAIAISRRNPRSKLKNPTLMDLKDENFVAIAQEESKGGHDLLLEQCRNSGFEPRIITLSTSPESLLLCIETGIGISVLDRNTRLEKNSSIRMIPLPRSSSADAVAIWLDGNNNPIIKHLIERLKG